MSGSSWVETLITSQVDGSPLNNTTSPTSILPGSAKYTLFEGYFSRAGQELLVEARGRISNIVTTPGTLTLDIRFGSIAVATSGPLALNTTAKTNVSFIFQMLLTCRAIGNGTSANLMGIGSFTSESVVGAAANTALTTMCPTSAAAVGSGFDSTVAQAIDLFGTWSVANTGNSITVHQYSVQSRN